MLDHKGLAKDHMGQALSQPCCWNTSFLIDISQIVKK